jgi:hypothetical protein
VSSSNLIRLSGLAAIVAGALLLVGALLSRATESENMSVSATTPSYAFSSLLYLIGAVLLLLGLVGLYVRQSEAAGILGLVAFLVAFFGTALALGATWAELFVAPSLAVEAPRVLDAEPTGMLALGFTLTFFVFLPLGWLLFGVASYRARIYPRVATILLMVGAVIAALPIPLTEIVLYVGVAWLGFTLFTGIGALDSEEQPARVR